MRNTATAGYLCAVVGGTFTAELLEDGLNVISHVLRQGTRENRRTLLHSSHAGDHSQPRPSPSGAYVRDRKAAPSGRSISARRRPSRPHFRAHRRAAIPLARTRTGSGRSDDPVGEYGDRVSTPTSTLDAPAQVRRAATSAPSTDPRDASGADGRFAAGAVFADHYRIVSLQGRGGMGEV
jgi:hypothetical protein